MKTEHNYSPRYTAYLLKFRYRELFLNKEDGEEFMKKKEKTDAGKRKRV